VLVQIAKLIYDLQSVGQSVLVSGTHLEPMTRFILSLWRLRVFLYGAPSLTRGWVCNLLVRLLLGIARAVTLGSKSRRTHGHILLSHLRLLQPGGSFLRIYIPKEQGGPFIPPGTGLNKIGLQKRIISVFVAAVKFLLSLWLTTIGKHKYRRTEWSAPFSWVQLPRCSIQFP
jgi:hypothetical protein